MPLTSTFLRSTALVAVLSSASALAAELTIIGDFPIGTPRGWATAVTADGSIVVGNGENPNSTAFVWSASTGIAALPYGNQTNLRNSATATSANGGVIVGVSRNAFNKDQASFWIRQPNGSYLHSFIHFPSEFYQFFETNYTTFAEDVSSDGNIIVGSGRLAPDPSKPQITQSSFAGWVFNRTTSKFAIVPDLPGGRFTSFARAVSGDGTVVAGTSSSANRPPPMTGTNNEAIRFTVPAQGLLALGDLRPDIEQYLSEAAGISRDGSTLVGRGRTASSGNAPFRWTEAGGMVSLGVLPASPPTQNGTARAANADGSVIIGEASTSSGLEAFVWTAQSGIRRLMDVAGLTSQDLNGGRLYDAVGISDDGLVMVGEINRPNPDNPNLGIREAYRLVLTQEELFPSSPPDVSQEQVNALAKLRASRDEAGFMLHFNTSPALPVSYTLQYSPDLTTPFTDRLTFTPDGMSGIDRGTPQDGYLGTPDATAILPEVGERFSQDSLPERGFWRLRVAVIKP